MIDQNTNFTKARKDTEIDCFQTTIKQLKTSDGLGILKGFKVGDTVVITIMSKRNVSLTTPSGIIHSKWVFDLIDLNGKPQGWIYAECVFPEMVSL